MPLPPVPNAAATAIVYEQFGQELVNVIKWSRPAALDLATVQALAGQVFLQWGNLVMPFMSYQTSMVRIECRQLVPLAGIAVDYEGDGPVPGDSTQDADNSQNATVISLRTGLAGRSYRGRLYIPGMPNGIVENGIVNATYRTDLAQAVETAIDNVANETGMDPVVLSYFNAKAQRVVPVATIIENVLSSTPYPGVQRRRRVGVGN